MDKATGELHDVSLSGLFADNKVEVDEGHTRFYDPTTNSTITWENGIVTVDLHAEELSLVGTASPAFAQDFVQITRFDEGHGSYQTWGFVAIDQMTLGLGDQTVELAAGSLGAFDRTLGHQRRAQNWNWIATAGTATATDDGETRTFALSLQEDRPQARPWVDARKHPAWAGDDFGKIEEVQFDYTSDPDTKETGDWSITGTGTDLSFTPKYHRRDLQGQIWIAETDFNQYYGELIGTFTLEGRTWEIGPVFALCEDSLIEL